MAPNSEKDATIGTEPATSPVDTPPTEEREVAEAAAKYGYGPLAKGNTFNALGRELTSTTVAPTPPAPAAQGFANPAPLGLSAFALTTFVLSLINMNARGTTAPNVVVGAAFGYGGFVQLLAGMWEMAVGNTFGATALSSYGGFWISYAIIYTPGGFQIIDKVVESDGGTGLNNTVGFWLAGWFIFTTIMFLCTLKTSIAFCSLFFFLDLAFLMLTIGHFIESAPGVPTVEIIRAGGFFGLVAAFIAWYCALAGVADDKNSFLRYPMGTFSWSPARRKKAEEHTV